MFISVKKALQKATPRQLLDALIDANPDLMVEYVVENKHQQVIDMYVSGMRKPIGFEQLEFRFMDTKGRRYYGFPATMPLPIERFGIMRDFMMWMTVGVSPKEFAQIIDAADKAWISTLKTNKNHQRIGLLLQELKLRMDMVIHTDLLYHFMAVQWVREDENPEVFDSEIQDAKVAQFKDDTRAGNTYFFFHQPELKQLNQLWNFTPDEWLAYWNESEAKQRFLKVGLKTILSDIESLKEKKISAEG